MKKSVYSLVLMDDVIRAVDREAYKRGTSRSNLINQILAEHLSCETPEMRMQDIFGSLSGLIDSCFSIQQQHSASLMTLRAALEYKYRPTISYKVELDRSPGEFLGTLKVQIRTQNIALIDTFFTYFLYRRRLEARCLAARGYKNYDSSLDGGVFKRSLINTGLSPEQTGEAISRYLNNLYNSMQVCLSSKCMDEVEPALAKDYNDMLDEYII
ncbi:MAG: hypothetical protein IKO47_00290 [Ruminococcus sp.]|nr:hypothetical protein [Ruminococcus sp.]